MQYRTVKKLIPAAATSDGAGVRIKRSLGQRQDLRLDPFLMLDEFGSEDAADYIAGFPAHPHRGFETVTYMLDGHMLHEDHLGNRGDLQQGGVQWMTAGRGIIHSEMPQQSEGLMRGFQLWLNLPAAEKMKPPTYRDIRADEIPRVSLSGGTAAVIAGELDTPSGRVRGPIHGLTTEPLYVDATIEPDLTLELPVPRGLNALLYPYEGTVSVGDGDLATSTAAVLSDGELVAITAGRNGARVLLLAGRPINEPVVQYGPFVMNTREEIEQALRDYRDGRLASPPARA